MGFGGVHDDSDPINSLRRSAVCTWIPSSENGGDDATETINTNIFRDLDSPVSEGGDNFSTGYVLSRHPCQSTISIKP